MKLIAARMASVLILGHRQLESLTFRKFSQHFIITVDADIVKKKYYYNFSEDKGQQRIFKARSQQQYFVIASGVGFTVDLLNKVSLQMTIGNVSFEKLSEIYNTELSLYGTDMILSSDLLEDNWVLFRLISEVNILKWERKAENSHCNTEKICQEVYPKFRNFVDNRWINHVCSEI